MPPPVSSPGAADLAALAMRIEAIGLREANEALDQIDARGRRGATSLTALERSSAASSQGLRRFEGVARGVGLALAGVQGPAAKFSNFLLALSPGGLYVGAAILGLGLLSREFQKTAQEAEEASKRTASALAASLPGAAKGPSLLESAGALREAASAARERARPTTFFGRLGAAFMSDESRELAFDEAAKLSGRADVLEGIRRKEIELMSTMKEREIIEFGIATLHERQLRALREQRALFLRGDIGGLAGAGPTPAGRQVNLITGEVFEQAPTRNARPGAGFNAQQAQKLDDAQRRVNEKRDEETKRLEQTAVAISAVSQAFAVLISSAQGGGNVGSVLGALLGIVGAALGGVPGAFLAGGGAIISAASAPRARAAPPLSSAPEPQAPMIFNTTVIGPNDPSAMRQISELVRNAALRGLSPALG